MKKKRTRVAIFGGSFDPPTIGHLTIVKYLIDRMGFDEVWLMPAYRHTFDKDLSEFEHRFNMCKLLIDNPKVKVSDFQYVNDCDSSTLNLFKALRKKYKDLDFYMIIGSDNANVIQKWINYEELIRTVPFIVLERAKQELLPNVKWCLNEPHIYVKDFKNFPICSTLVRLKVKNDQSVEGLINPEIIEYVKKHNLYKK